MNKMIKCPKCQSEKLALSGFRSDAMNLQTLLCLDCTHVFYMETGIIEPNPSGNLDRLLKNMIALNELAKAMVFYSKLTGADRREAKDYINLLAGK